MESMTIGEFAARTRLSRKALRLYDELKLVVPASVDPHNGYRRYHADQVEPARLVARLRQAGMPLALIAPVLAMDKAEAAQAITRWWETVEDKVAQRRALVAYLQARLSGEDHAMYDVQLHSMPQRSLLTISRHLHIGETGAFFGDAFARLRAAGPGLAGIAGVPFLIFYGEVSEDSDGPLELCRPVAEPVTTGPVTTGPVTTGDPGAGIQLRSEPAHEEAYIRLALKDTGWPAILPALDALERWAAAKQRQPAGLPRQLLLADQRTATPETLVCDLSLPLR